MRNILLHYSHHIAFGIKGSSKFWEFEPCNNMSKICSDWTSLLCKRLINLTRKLDKGDRDNLVKSAQYLEKMKQYAYAIEIYQNIGDLSSLIRLQVETEMWEEVGGCHICLLVWICNQNNSCSRLLAAFMQSELWRLRLKKMPFIWFVHKLLIYIYLKLFNQAIDIALKHPEHKSEVYYPYALWLAERDLFEEAQQGWICLQFMQLLVNSRLIHHNNWMWMLHTIHNSWIIQATIPQTIIK